MHTPTTVTFLFSLHTLSCYAASVYQPGTIVRPSQLLNVTGNDGSTPTGGDGSTSSLQDFVPQQHPRPVQVDYLINDYTVRVAVDASTTKPDSGNNSPDIYSQAVAKISAWAPNQPGYPTKYHNYPTRINHQDSIGNRKFTIEMEGYRLDLDNTMVQVAIEGIRRYAVISRSNKLTDNIFLQVFDEYSLSAIGGLKFEPSS